ncbi:MAG: hypothetical protein H3C54_01505 [Taibaiella sp.]|nr:hypothetical protein [Taibaiella sp.]
MRNFNDPVLSQFNIYIDGRPCDDPAAPVNTDLPPGIVMLPRKAKKMLQEPSASGSEELSPAGGGVTPVTGVGHSRGTENTNPTLEKSTQNGNPPATLGAAALSPAACLPRPFRGPDCFGSSLSQPKVGRGDPARLSRAIRDAGTGVEHSRRTENTNPPLEKNTENGNPPATLSHQDREKKETPLLFLGGENGEMPTGMSHSGEVDSRRTLPQENSTQNGNPPATLGTQYTSPAQEKNPLENGNTSLVPNSVGGATLSSETTLSNATYPDPFGGDSLSPAGGGVTPVTGVGHSRGTENTRLDPVSPNSPLYHTYLHILEKRKLAEEDILHATWYSQHKRAEAEAPPPHIYTDEEIAEMDRALAEERSRTLGQPQYNTFGKMYFPEKDTRCNL